MSAPLLVVGDALLDHDLSGRAERLAPDAPVPVVAGARRSTGPGGAALAAWLAAGDGRDVTLITALGEDDASRTLRALLAGRVHLLELPLTGRLSCKTRVLAGDHALLRIDDGDGRAARSTDEALARIGSAGAILVSDYGRGTAEVLRGGLAAAARRVPLVWDPHPRGGSPVPGARLVTPSAAEARAFADASGRAAREPAGTRSAAADAGTLVTVWDVASVAVTLGEAGALLSHGAEPLLVPAPGRAEGDTCGAGDRFAATAAGLVADGELTETAVQEAVAAATRYVAQGGARAVRPGDRAGAAVPRGDREDGVTGAACDKTSGRTSGRVRADELAAAVRAAGGTVVAAGGCFDLLHAGHVALLEAARRAGDCLVVCVNSDASVRRRKGRGRPLVPLADRVKVLSALGCVDAVAVFDQDTPEDLLKTLRPHIWAKGADYALSELPETALLESWGGQVVLLPYLDGRSTTTLAERASRSERPVAAPDPR